MNFACEGSCVCGLCLHLCRGCETALRTRLALKGYETSTISASPVQGLLTPCLGSGLIGAETLARSGTWR
jgi:hypothetical protein